MPKWRQSKVGRSRKCCHMELHGLVLTSPLHTAWHIPSNDPNHNCRLLQQWNCIAGSAYLEEVAVVWAQQCRLHCSTVERCKLRSHRESCKRASCKKALEMEVGGCRAWPHQPTCCGGSHWMRRGWDSTARSSKIPLALTDECASVAKATNAQHRKSWEGVGRDEQHR